MKAEIISIGDELLIGQVVNTNASWMAAELNKSGIRVVHVTVISDQEDDIHQSLDEALQRADIILMTGGLGPTKDDITKLTLARYFGVGMVFHEPTYKKVKAFFAARNFNMTDINRHQADIPENCVPIENNNGTAPGMWFEKNGKVIVSMPGVPFEMKPMMTDQVLPRLLKKYKPEPLFYKTIMTTGMPESFMSEKIKKWEESLPQHIKLAYLPQPGIIRLRLSASGKDKEKLKKEIEKYCNDLNNYIPDLVYGYDEVTLEEVTGSLLRERNKTVSTAESCTGGYLAHLITSIPGSSDYYTGSVISYANSVKTGQLGVDPGDLEKYGAVSRQVVEQMALGIKEKLGTDYSLAVSGIAGPDGGTKEKPVGTVWIAVATSGNVKSKLFHFGEHRGRNIRRSALAALNMLRLEILKETT
ncbi:MAG TPA: competence/damage-inducible protein A [Bacteroidetes bacterium]|nr:competence/damage-inducible protein A [Bacteroidota bacterium]